MIKYRYMDDTGRQAQHDTGISLLREIMSEEFLIEITEADVERGEFGKPFFKKENGVYFSISHTNGLCCCIAASGRCGIDCERIRDIRPKVSQRFMTERELYYFSRLPEEKKPSAFYLLWTLKEAYGKYTGKGIGDMKNITISFEDGGLISDRTEVDFFVYRDGCYYISVCIEKGQAPECGFGKRVY